eukprot:TRINITY_DN2095_c0_g1_i3.p1 TRINITY_DN2095_c0_g1~~TRINITY_DN2095_c0_g1_i3.p1  ORF type:complete len:338 (-),score=49.28 TRINITY_DN2095_c0_g1_i3:112-1125(-)
MFTTSVYKNFSFSNFKTSKNKFKCVCGKGFGDVTKKQTEDTKAVNKKAVKQAMKDVKRAKHLGIRPVDPEEAEQGKVDYATVKTWGNEDKELEELEVKDFRSVPQNKDVPFSHALAQHLDQLQRSGSLNTVSPDGKPFPEFKKWAFKRRHYMQYLIDMQALHTSLEEAIHQSLQINQTGQQFLKEFGQSAEWDRAEIIASDLKKFQQSALDEDFSLLTVSKQTEVYCGELIRLGQSQQEQTVLKLIAHIYAIMLSTLTQGVRIGSVVAQKLSLVQIDAIDMYRKWPQTQDDPMKAICGFIDHVGDQINDDQKEVIYNEIGRAFLEASRIMQHLAKEK